MKPLKQLYEDFKKSSDEYRQLQDNLPRIIGVESVRIVKENFRRQGYDSGSGFRKWKSRAKVTDTAYDYNRTKKYRTPKLGKKSTYKNPLKGSKYKSTNPILMQTRNLMNSVEYKASGRIVEIGINENLIPYAKKMNEGGKGKWGKYATTNTPARPFIPIGNPNKKIIKAIAKKFKYERNKAFKNFVKRSVQTD